MSDQDRKGRVNLDDLYHSAQEKVAWPQGQFNLALHRFQFEAVNMEINTKCRR